MSVKKIAEVEYLRALAILFTLLAHFRFAYSGDQGWVTWLDARAAFHGGVDLFFVISGFVISRSLIPAALSAKGMPAATRVVSDFWVRRVYRLWPSSWLWAALGLTVIFFTQRTEVLATVYDVLAAVTQVYNLHAWSCANGVGTCSHQAVGVYWSLSLEEQFYVLLPLLLIFLRVRARWVLVVLALLAPIAQTFYPGIGGFFRWEAFCLGVLLAWSLSDVEVGETIATRLLEPLRPIVWLGALALAAALPAVGAGKLGLFAYPITAVLSAGLVLIASVDRGLMRIPRWLGAALLWVGSRSYSIYLTHSVVFLVFKYFDGKGWRPAGGWGHVLWLGTATALIAIVSELNFRFVESRFRK